MKMYQAPPFKVIFFSFIKDFPKSTKQMYILISVIIHIRISVLMNGK